MTKCRGSGDRDVSDFSCVKKSRLQHAQTPSIDPKGEVLDVVDGEATATTKRGNEIKKNGDEENPAVVIHTASGSDAIKKVSQPHFVVMSIC